MIILVDGQRAGWSEMDHPRDPDGKFAGVPGMETKWSTGKRKGIRHETMTATRGGKKMGHVRLVDEGREIDDLYVTPAARGKGVAHQLLKGAIEKHGHQTMRLHASPFGPGGPDADGLQKLYARHGFEPEPSRGKGYMVRHPTKGFRHLTEEGRRRKAKGHDNGELKEYWTQDPEGLAKWAKSAHPWTALYNELKEHIKNDALAKATASAWYKDVFGHTPNQKKKGRAAPDGVAGDARIGTPPFLSGVDGYLKGNSAMADGLTLEQCMVKLRQAMADGDQDEVGRLKSRITQLKSGDRSAVGERSGYGEGPGGSQKGPSIKALKAQIKQAREDGDFELVGKLRDKLKKLTGSEKNDAPPWADDSDDADGDAVQDADADEGEGEDADEQDEDEDKSTARSAAMRSLPIVRSMSGPATAPTLARPSDDEPEPEQVAGGGTFVRASYRTGRDGEGSDIMTLRFSAFNNWYEIDSAREGRFLERVAPGAFTKTIGERGGQVKVLFNHGHDNQIGEKILGKIITLEERKDGAYAEIELFDTSYNRDLLPGLRSGAYGSSFMFNVMDDAWDDRPERSESNPDGVPERTVRALRLLEFGPVTWPANPAATAGMRSDTDVYCDGLRANRPETYNGVEKRFAEFRSALPRTSVDEAAPQPGTPADTEAAIRDDAPVKPQADHAEIETTNSAETRRSRLMLAGVIEE